MLLYSVHFISVTFLILRRTEEDVIKKMHIGLRVGYPSILSDFNEILIFSTDFRKILKKSYFTKMLPVEAEMFHAAR